MVIKMNDWGFLFNKIVIKIAFIHFYSLLILKRGRPLKKKRGNLQKKRKKKVLQKNEKKRKAPPNNSSFWIHVLLLTRSKNNRF
jgi:hypothetical protein